MWTISYTAIVRITFICQYYMEVCFTGAFHPEFLTWQGTNVALDCINSVKMSVLTVLHNLLTGEMTD